MEEMRNMTTRPIFLHKTILFHKTFCFQTDVRNMTTGNVISVDAPTYLSSDGSLVRFSLANLTGESQKKSGDALGRKTGGFLPVEEPGLCFLFFLQVDRKMENKKREHDNSAKTN